jgi:hypothetical protein
VSDTFFDKLSDSSFFLFLIVGGLYSITTLRKIGAEETVYSKDRELKQASKQASATTKT